MTEPPPLGNRGDPGPGREAGWEMTGLDTEAPRLPTAGVVYSDVHTTTRTTGQGDTAEPVPVGTTSGRTGRV